MDRAGAVEYCDDDDQGNSIGSSSWGYLVLPETRQSPYAVAMAMTAFKALLVSSSSLISIAGGDGGPITVII